MWDFIRVGAIILASLTNFLIGFIVFKNNPRNRINVIFLFICLSMGLWGFSLLFYQFPLILSSLFWIKATYLSASVCTSLIFLFSFIFPTPVSRRSWPWAGLFGAAFLGLTVGLLFFTQWWVIDVVTNPLKGLQTLWGAGYYWWLVALWVAVVWAIVNSIVSSRHSSGLEKLRSRYFFLVFCVFSAIVCIPDVIIPIFFHTTSYFYLSAVFSFIFSGAIAYSIVKHRLMDIRLVVARSVGYSILIILLGAIYAAGLFLVGPLLFEERTSIGNVTVSTVLALIIAFSFQPLEKLMRKATNRIFFKTYYESDVLLSKLTHIMAGTIELEDIINRLLETLLKEMNISKGAFLIVKDHAITDTLGIGYADHEFAVPQLEELFHQATGASSYFIFEDLEEGRLKQLFRKLDISIVIPIKVENREVALLILGGKKSGEIYYKKDVEFLNTFASEAGIAIQNAQAYTEIRKFSKELEQRVEERTKQLKSSQERELAEARNVARLKDEFVFIAAHELRTPVAAIRGFLELVSSSSVKFPRDIKENLNAISSASNVLNQLIGDLLEIARSESGTTKISVSPTNVMPIVKSVIGEMRPLAVKQKVKIKLESHKTVPRALVNPQKIREVIMNLMSNGIKYNKAGGTLDISVSSQRSELTMKFKDTGYGIPKDQQGKIFEKFFRAHVKGTQEVLGTGLGLFIVRMLVEKMDGKVSFSSVEGKGSTFTVSFPAATD